MERNAYSDGRDATYRIASRQVASLAREAPNLPSSEIIRRLTGLAEELRLAAETNRTAAARGRDAVKAAQEAMYASLSRPAPSPAES